MAEAAVHIKCGQTTLAVETFFKKLAKLPEKRDDIIYSLAEHLVSCKIISQLEMDELKRKYPQTNSLIMRMEALIKKRDSHTWAVILRWLELKPLIQNELLPIVEQYELQYVLEELFRCERDVTANYSACMDKLIRIAGSFGHRVGSELENDESMYETIRNAVRKRYFPIDKLRSVLTRELTKSKPEGLIIRNISKEAVSWQSFVGAMKRPKSSGNPFIFYAASKYMEIHIHVISAITGEEYTFYPFYQPSLRARCPHVYVGHVYKKYYVCLHPKTEHDYALTRQITLVTLDRLHREKFYIETELGEIKTELRRLKIEKGAEPVDSKSKQNYQKQIQLLKDQISTYEKERGEKEELVKAHNDQLKTYEHMLKKSMDETKKLRKYIEERDEKFRRELEERTEEQKRIIEDFVTQTSDRVSGASVRAVNNWSTGSNPTRDSPRTSRRAPQDTGITSRGYSPTNPRQKNVSRNISPTYDRSQDYSQNVQVYEKTADLPDTRRSGYSGSQPPYQRRPPPDRNWDNNY